jgi:chromosome transmission fidelity protein 1
MKKQSLQRTFKAHAWESEVLDVEDLVQLGQGLGTCPYYGSRQLIPSADLVIMPYQSLLHYQTRESLGVKLDGCVVVIDEAHNLVDSISNMYSCQISFSQVRSYLCIFHTLHSM